MLIATFAMNVLADNVKFKVSNMHCGNCAKRVEKALKANEAVSEVKVNLESKAVCVSYDAAKTDVETIQKALADAKFRAEVVKQCDKAEGCKHEDKAGEHKCNQERKQEGEHKCGANGCGHEKNTQE